MTAGAEHGAPGLADTPTTLGAADLKARLAEELATLARDMAAFQATLSALLEDGRLAPEQVRQLQDLDRATQMLDNLHRVATALAASHPNPLAATDIDALVTLGDLKRRLAGHHDTPERAGRPRDGEPDDIAWL